MSINFLRKLGMGWFRWSSIFFFVLNFLNANYIDSNLTPIYSNLKDSSKIIGYIPTKYSDNMNDKRYISLNIGNYVIYNKIVFYKISFFSLNKHKIIYGYYPFYDYLGWDLYRYRRNNIKLYKVINHKPKEFLNVRIGPSSKFDIIDKLEYNQKNIIRAPRKTPLPTINHT